MKYEFKIIKSILCCGDQSSLIFCFFIQMDRGSPASLGYNKPCIKEFYYSTLYEVVNTKYVHKD
jgi:hypothetical protein